MGALHGEACWGEWAAGLETGDWGRDCALEQTTNKRQHVTHVVPLCVSYVFNTLLELFYDFIILTFSGLYFRYRLSHFQLKETILLLLLLLFLRATGALAPVASPCQVDLQAL